MAPFFLGGWGEKVRKSVRGRHWGGGCCREWQVEGCQWRYLAGSGQAGGGGWALHGEGGSRSQKWEEEQSGERWNVGAGAEHGGVAVGGCWVIWEDS